MNEVNDVAPSSLSHLVGQRSVIEQVRVAIDAAFADNRKFDSAMLVGPPGVGKTALASVVAQEMATEFHDILGQSIKGISDLNALLLAANDKDVIHIDEAHELDKRLQTVLYLAIDRKKVLVRGRGGGAIELLGINTGRSLNGPSETSMPGRTIAIGDIHGCSTALAALLQAIDPQPDDTIITLGDYVDRGIDSKGVLDQLIALADRCRLVPLLGNHDEMMLHARDGRGDFQFWLRGCLQIQFRPVKACTTQACNLRFVGKMG